MRHVGRIERPEAVGAEKPETTPAVPEASKADRPKAVKKGKAKKA